MKKQRKKRQSRFHNTKSFLEELVLSEDSKYSAYILVGVSSPKIVGFSWGFPSYIYKLNYPLIKQIWKTVLQSRRCSNFLFFTNTGRVVSIWWRWGRFSVVALKQPSLQGSCPVLHWKGTLQTLEIHFSGLVEGSEKLETSEFVFISKATAEELAMLRGMCLNY